MMNMNITRNHAAAYDIAPQRDDESDNDFRYRVAGELRAQGKVIEAHEAHKGALYSDEDGGADVLTGILGAIAMALHGVNLSPHDSERRIDDDFAAGVLVQDTTPKMTPEQAQLLLSIHDATRRK